MRNVISIVKKREIKDIVPCLLLITFLLYYSRLSVQETVLFTMDWDFLYQLTIKTIICGLVHSPTWSRWFLIRFSSWILSYMKSHLKLTSICAICLSEINLLIYLIITSSGISFLGKQLNFILIYGWIKFHFFNFYPLLYNRHLGWYHNLVLLNSVAKKMDVHLSLLSSLRVFE